MADTDSNPPVFVYGALRSGTTMFRLMLNSHGQIQNNGEADYLFDHLRLDPAVSGGWRYERDALAADRSFRRSGVDLMGGLDGLTLLSDMLAQLRAMQPGKVLTLNVHRNADRILAALPQARFIHLLRDPRDVARSSIGMGWAGNSYYGVGHWIDTERDWDKISALLADHQLLTLSFESLMNDLRDHLTEVCDFLGVPFVEAMLDYHLNSTYGPPDPRIAQQWRRKAAPSEVALIEGRCAELMRDRGYPAEIGPKIPGTVARLQLAAQHRLRRWRYNIGRFGAPLFFAHHASRLLRLRGLEKRLHGRIEQKIIARLK